MDIWVVVLFVLGLLGFLAAVIVVGMRPDKSPSWPSTEGTIQLVNKVFVNAGRASYSLDVADFSYRVNDEYYSGRLTLSSSPSSGNGSPISLINQKILVLYDPQSPEKFRVQQPELAGFLLASYNEPLGTDVDPIDLNLDKI
jgi:hypothetical protein